MNDLHLTRILAPQALTCFQCFNLGLTADTIAKGETCIEIESPDRGISFACEDCFERLKIEIDGMESDEPEIDSGFDVN